MGDKHRQDHYKQQTNAGTRLEHLRYFGTRLSKLSTVPFVLLLCDM